MGGARVGLRRLARLCDTLTLSRLILLRRDFPSHTTRHTLSATIHPAPPSILSLSPMSFSDSLLLVSHHSVFSSQGSSYSVTVLLRSRVVNGGCYDHRVEPKREERGEARRARGGDLGARSGPFQRSGKTPPLLCSMHTAPATLGHPSPSPITPSTAATLLGVRCPLLLSALSRWAGSFEVALVDYFRH